MTQNPNPVPVATINNGTTTLYADVSGGLNPASAIIVTTTAPVALLKPPGWPSRPSLRGEADFPGNVIPSAATVTLLAPEAAAWIAAGVAVQTGAT